MSKINVNKAGGGKTDGSKINGSKAGGSKTDGIKIDGNKLSGSKSDGNKILPYVEPIFRFCCKRLAERCDAEDLASHVLEGMNKYEIESLDAWVWRIAHNRYARFIDDRNKNRTVSLSGDELFNIADYCEVDEESAEERYETVFRYLHTLSSEYKNIFVDYYIGELSIKNLSEKYSLPETTVKWRLNAGRQKIRNRIGENKMDKVYRRINWNTQTCNGNMDSDAYLHTQIARAICLAAYEKPLTVEEISVSTGIPTMYIEDELPRLEYGDAICKSGNKYAANFIIFRMKDRKQTEDVSEAAARMIADKLEEILKNAENKIAKLNFYGSDFGIKRLGFIVIPYLLRRKIGDIKNNRLKLENGPYPPRKDGGYGWLIVEETADESENCSEYNSGCNVAGDDGGSERKSPTRIYYYWIGKYLDDNIYRDKGMRGMCANGILKKSANGVVQKDALSDEDAANFIETNLLIKSGDHYLLNFPHFTAEQFGRFVSLFEINDEKLDGLLEEWITAVRDNFERFVPKRLHGQINQWVGYYLHRLIGYAVSDLIRRGVLREPEPKRPLIDGVFSVEGEGGA